MFKISSFVIIYVSFYQSGLSLSGSCPWMDSRIEATDGCPEKRVHFDRMNTINIEIQTG